MRKLTDGLRRVETLTGPGTEKLDEAFLPEVLAAGSMGVDHPIDDEEQTVTSLENVMSDFLHTVTDHAAAGDAMTESGGQCRLARHAAHNAPVADQQRQWVTDVDPR